MRHHVFQAGQQSAACRRSPSVPLPWPPRQLHQQPARSPPGGRGPAASGQWGRMRMFPLKTRRPMGKMPSCIGRRARAMGGACMRCPVSAALLLPRQACVSTSLKHLFVICLWSSMKRAMRKSARTYGGRTICLGFKARAPCANQSTRISPLRLCFCRQRWRTLLAPYWVVGRGCRGWNGARTQKMWTGVICQTGAAHALNRLDRRTTCQFKPLARPLRPISLQPH